MAWWLLGKESKREKRLRQLEEFVLESQRDVKGPVETKEPEPVKEKDDGIPFVELRGEWDPTREGFSITIDWNAPFLQRMIPMGVEGETEFEVAAYGATLLAHQILETEQERRANDKATIEKYLDEE